MRRSTSTVRRACAVGTTVALIGLTTGLGIMTATSASADGLDPVAGGTGAEAPATPGTSTPTDAPSTPAADPSEPAADPGTADPSAPAADPSEPAADPSGSATQPTDTVTAPPRAITLPHRPAATDAGTDVSVAAAPYTATITGTPKVGETLGVTVTGFDDGSSYTYLWTDEDATVLSHSGTYTIGAAEVGKTITVLVTGSLPGETATDTTDTAVTQTPVFVDADGQPVTDGASSDEPLALSGTAGEAFSYTFRATGSPTPKLSLSWFYPDEESDDTDPEDDSTPTDQLPDGITFDPTTGVLSGTTDWATYYDFAITATSGTESVTQYVELTVDAAAPLGIQVLTGDRSLLTSEGPTDSRAWIVDTDGSIYTLTTEETDDGSSTEITEGGRPTVRQGQSLFVSGDLVDRYGNSVDDGSGEYALPTVTSDVASDIITPDPDLGDFGFVDVRFPHASIHTLTVASGAFATSFGVQVVPTPATTTVPTVATGPTVTTGTTGTTGRQLAYTGTDATGALPWALGLVLAGVGLIGARSVRRRRAQR
ncbi:putative Ig domain-containing protein [Curtobacterium pusillum]|uniref:putative Ig domain-containing protein n=1 Tax=Curtobacterium pusillum TaxID=69373 RepID=UPI0011A7715A|nr:putative Ig domain-containing protein [Curtobacterium pusillum]